MVVPIYPSYCPQELPSYCPQDVTGIPGAAKGRWVSPRYRAVLSCLHHCPHEVVTRVSQAAGKGMWYHPSGGLSPLVPITGLKG